VSKQRINFLPLINVKYEIPGYKLVGKPKNTEGKYVEGTTEVIYEYEKVEELNVPMDPKGSNNPKESLKGESLNKSLCYKTQARKRNHYSGRFYVSCQDYY
jgi:hypothetical protein